ncbi:SusC/RagA family TonB-linked outer membrane protein [Bacteroidia bacterium]|nr:SusC/RagA family TonB-linked outer membrane protein [Bacteroidia bacterium]
MLLPYLVWAQQTITVNGSVKDESGEELIGVTILVEGNTSIGANTNVDGNYTIVTSPQSTLVFSYLGYRVQKVAVNGKTRIDVVMVTESTNLEEVVVVAFGAQKKATVTGAISSVSTVELLKSPSGSLGNALTGKMPGLSSVQFSGLPGGDDPQILIRGVGSLSQGASQPLILVDGVERSFTQLDANEVESINILKDASATAVFGVRGANGVILVTTKRGEAGKTNISATASYSLTQPTNFVKFANSYDYATAFNNAQLIDGVSANQLKYSPEAIQAFKDHSQPLLYPDTDWISTIMKDFSDQSQYNLNISGGNETARFFVSVGMLQQRGLFKSYSAASGSDFGYDRYNYRANLDLNLSKSSILSVTLGGRLQSQKTLADGETDIFTYIMDSPPMSGAGIVDGKRILANPEYVGEYARDAFSIYYGQGYTVNTSNVLNFDLQFTQKLDMITQGLSFNIKGSYNGSYDVNRRRRGSLPSYMPVKLLDAQGNWDGKSVGLEKSGDAEPLGFEERLQFANLARDWYMDSRLEYVRRFGRHNVFAQVLYNQTKKYYPEGTYNDIPRGYVGLVGRATYDYAGKYLLDLSMGYNGSENFAPGKRYGIFPAGSIGWVLTSEKFLEDQDFLSFLKLRYSYGVVGNDNINNRFVYLPGAYGFGIRNTGNNGSLGYNFGTGTTRRMGGAYESTLGNPDVSWEKAIKQNVGVDVRILNNRLGITADVWREDRRDILIQPDVRVPSFVSFANNPPINYGKVENKGYEISLSWSDKIGDDIRYTISPNISFNRNKIVEMMEVRQDYDYMYRTGHKVGQPFGYEFFGFYNGAETEAKYKQKYGVDMPTQMVSNLFPGDCVYVDLNGDGKIDTQDQHAIGYGDFPEYSFGLTLGFEYKKISVSALLVGATNVGRNLGYIYRPQWGEKNISALSQWVLENSWTPETKDSAILPNLSQTHVANNTLQGGNSSVWTVDTSYGRLKNLEISYNFGKIPQLPFVKNARIYVSGYNLLTFTKFKGNDPENTGGTYLNNIRYPITRIFNLGLNLNF